jgi:hypothetical protein
MSLRIQRRLAAVTAMVAAVVLTVAVPAHAAALTSVGWSVSQPQPGTTNVRYTWSFTTASGPSTINYVTMTVPATTAVPGALTVQDYYGVSIGTASYAAGVVTFEVTTPASIAAGTPILISIDGFTNPTTAGNAYTSTVTTELAGHVAIDTAASNAVAINDTSTAVTVVIARSTAFTSNTTGFDLLMDAAIPGQDSQYKDVQLTVKTNAASGYTLRTQIDHQPRGVSNPAVSLPAVAGSVGSTVVSPPANTFGYKVQGSTGNGAAGSQMTAGYAGYTAGMWGTAFFSGVPTNSDTITLRNQAYIDFLQTADTYTASITYSVTPTY